MSPARARAGAPPGVCVLCGHRMGAPSERERYRHRVAHDQWRRGVRLPAVTRPERVGAVLEFDLCLVRPTSGAILQRLRERVTRFLIGEHFQHRGPRFRWYCRTPMRRWQTPRLLTHLLMLTTPSHVVGALLLEWRPLAGVRRWCDPPDRIEPAAPGVNDWCLSYAWLHRNLRRRHIGPLAAKAAACGLDRRPSDFLFLPPFTRKGESVSRAVSPGLVKVAKEVPPTSYANLVLPFDPDRGA
jgi:hypothetical protein